MRINYIISCSLVFFISIIIFSSCQQNKEKWQSENATKYLDQKTLRKKRVFSFPIDSNIALVNSNSFRIMNDSIMFFGNNDQSKVFYYNIKNGELLNSYYFPPEGPNALIKDMCNYFIPSSIDDVITFCHRKAELGVYQDGQLKHRISLVDTANFNKKARQGKNPFFSYPAKPSIFDVVDSSVFVTYFQSKETECGNIPAFRVFKIPINTHDSIKAMIPLAQNYKTGYYGHSFNSTLPCLTYNSKKKVISSHQPASHYIENYNLNGDLLETSFVGSKYYSNVIPPFSDQYEKNRREEVDQYLATQFHFLDLIYDQYRNLYYQWCKLPVPLDIFKQTGWYTYECSLLILDEDLKKIGEVDFKGGNNSNNYNVWNTMICPEGLILMRNDLYEKNPNSFYFEVFDVVEK
ncbi:MAG: DUF4221 family protein [Bacteroidales bacterium]